MTLAPQQPSGGTPVMRRARVLAVLWTAMPAAAQLTAAPTPRPTTRCDRFPFLERIVADSADGAEDVFAIDVDGDGDVDALSASYYDDTFAWHENDGFQSLSLIHI